MSWCQAQANQVDGGLDACTGNRLTLCIKITAQYPDGVGDADSGIDVVGDDDVRV